MRNTTTAAKYGKKAALLCGCLISLTGPALHAATLLGFTGLIDPGILTRLPTAGAVITTNPVVPDPPPPNLAQDLAIPGKISVSIQPAEAIADGARWTLDNGPELASGFVQEGVGPGLHTVRFNRLSAWRLPAQQELLVIGGRTNQATAVFTRLPSFDFQSVPEQQAPHGETLEFFVGAEAPGTALQATVQPQPAGSITFDPATGHFVYTPVATDRLPFSVTFASSSGQSGTSTITPIPKLAPEEVTLNYNRALPNDETRDYITISEATNPSEAFNDSPRETLSVSISGKTLVFAADHPARLHQQFHQRENIKQLNLFADRVIIRSPLSLPQTHVTIHARELRFEGDGLIDTTPLARVKVPTGAVPGDGLKAGINGDSGHPGGDVDVLVERFHADSSGGKRFILRGGNGGPAGEGRDGQSELSVPFPSAAFNNLMARCGNKVCTFSQGRIIIYTEDKFGTEPADICGSKVAARGENGVKSGLPGLGGKGGVLKSTVNLNGFADLAGGSAGTKGGNHVGSSLSRVYGYLVKRTIFKNGQPIVSGGFSAAVKVRGSDATAPTASAFGPNGQVQLLNDPAAWLHSFGLRGVIQFAKDAYLNGHEIEARALLGEYGELIRALQPAVPTSGELSEAALAELANLSQELLEMETINHRIDSNLDFFGNPAGFVPMLSFEANLAAFESEIDQSIPILYLAHFLGNAVTTLEESLSASEVAHDKLEVELDKMITDFNQAQVVIPRLKVEAETIQLRIGALRGRLSLLLEQLEKRAAANVEDRHKLPFWKKALGTLSVVAELVPVGQPVVGKIGAGLGLIAKLDPDNVVESAKSLGPQAFAAFSKKDISVCFTGTTIRSGIPFIDRLESEKRRSDCGKFLAGEMKELAGVFKEAQADKGEIAAELQKLKATDPIFNEVTQELEELNTEKERFAQELAAALQTVATLTGAMTENVLTTDQLDERIGNTQAVLDHNALLHIKELEERAKDRLLKFQYFAGKAFTYRTLQPFNGNLQLNRLFDRFKALVEGGSSHVLSQEEFLNLKSLYVAELRDIVSQAFDFVNSNAPERSLPISFRLNDQELQQLNQQGQLVINLQKRGLFPAGRQNIRIADLRTRKLTVHLEGGTVGAHALLFLDFEHLGISRLSSGGQTFLFRHQQNGAVNPITWGTVYDGVADRVSNSELSPSSQSLIRALLNQPTSEDLLLFSRPAAAADIQLTKQVLTDNGINMVIDELQVEVTFESAQASASLPELSVFASGDLEPVITLNRADVNGRQDGVGNFRRVYPVNTVLALEAPTHFGELTFDRWFVNGQARTAGATTLPLTLAFNTRVEARFVAVSSSSTSSPSSTPSAAPGAIALASLKPTAPTIANTLAVDGSATALSGNALASSPLPTGSSVVSFEFSTVAGLRYVIEAATDLDDPNWTTVDVVTGTGETMRYVSPTATQGVFRVRVDEENSRL